MAFIKKGTLTVAANTTAQNLVLGFVPSYFRMMNKTKLAATTNGVVIAEWYDDMANASANLWTTSGGDGTIKLTQTAANGFTPFLTSDALLYVPNQLPYTSSAGNRQYIGPSTNLVITGLSNAANASVTATHSFTTADIGVTVVTFHGVVGMTQINGLSGVIQTVTSTTSFTVNINTTNFGTYVAGTAGLTGGFANVITGAPANTLYGNVSLPTAQQNLGQIGLTLGTSLMVNVNDVWEYVAMLDTPVTS
jgi:hypothetical protein